MSDASSNNTVRKRQNTFKQADVTRAVKGVIAAGGNIGRVKICKTGDIIVEFGDAETTEVSELDRWRGSHGSRSS